MFNTKVNTKAISTEALAARAKDVSTTAATAAQTAAAAAQSAAQTAAMAAQVAAQEVSTAAQTAATGVSKGVYNARRWAAPQLENAAEYTTTTAAPKVSAVLLSTARQVNPEDVPHQSGLPRRLPGPSLPRRYSRRRARWPCSSGSGTAPRWTPTPRRKPAAGPPPRRTPPLPPRLTPPGPRQMPE